MTLLEHMIESHPILENSFRMDSFIEVLKKNNKRTNLLKAFVLSYLSLFKLLCVFPVLHPNNFYRITVHSQLLQSYGFPIDVFFIHVF
jgi:hypothetical protein